MTRLIILMSFIFLLASAPGRAQTNVDASHFKQLIAKNANALNFTKTDLANYRIINAYYDDIANASMVYVQQTIKGVDIYNAITAIAFKNDKVVSVQSSAIKDAETRTKNIAVKPSITPINALYNTIADLKTPLTRPVIAALKQTADGQEFEYDNLGIAINNITVRLMWIAKDESAKLKLAWQVSLLTLQENNQWLVNVDALSGQIISKDNLTSRCSFTPSQRHNVYCYEVQSFDDINSTENTNSVTEVAGVLAVDTAKFNVIPYPSQDPNFSAPVLVTNPWTMNGNAKAYTKKWNSDATKDYDSLKGNNVQAYEDINHDNKAGFSPKSSTPLPKLTWNYTPNYSIDPLLSSQNESFGITNLFYMNNLMHDMSYNYGFDEKAGNMQSTNLGRGGKQADWVLAEALDGSGTSNANFAPAVDGQKSRMQMFLWSGSPLKILTFNSPNDLLGPMATIEGAVSDNNKLADIGVITANVVYFNDLGASTHKACVSASNNSQLAGKIAYIDRGGCTFAIKIKKAQLAGAIGVIVGDSLTVGSRLVTMVATPLDNTITIPAVFVVYEDAQRIKADLNASLTVNATLSPVPRIDGDLDNGVISHEYTHGISNRLTGGPGTVSCLNNGEQMGEGWSDYFALMMTTDWNTATKADSNKANPIGNYVIGYTPSYGGIRTYPYSKSFAIDPWTYDSLKVDTSIHEYNASTNPGAIYYTGEVWCSALWDMTWNLITTDGINKKFFKAANPGGNTVAMKLVIQAMKLQKCSPGCVDGRNAILKADTLLYSGIHSAQIWKAFARRGLGYSASQGTNTKIKDGTAAYDLPPGISFTANNTSADEQKVVENKPFVQIMPNPAKDYISINVKGNTTRLMVQIISEGGAQIGTYTMTGEYLKVNISKLSAGVYNVLIAGEGVSSKYKLVVQ